jgi:hypothetical protein
VLVIEGIQEYSIYTTGIGRFAECLKHSAKPDKHSTKTLPSVTLGKESSANSRSATASLPSTFYRALDKDFTECHKVLGKEKPPSRRLVTETTPMPSVLGDTRQRNYLYRQLANTLGKKITSLPSVHKPALGKGSTSGPFVSFFAECSRRHSAKLASLPSARATTLGKEALPVPRRSFSTECYGPDTRQSTSLLSVTLGKVTSLHIFNLFLLFHPNKHKI